MINKRKVYLLWRTRHELSPLTQWMLGQWLFYRVKFRTKGIGRENSEK